MESAGNWLNVPLKNMHEVIAMKEKKVKKPKPKLKQTVPSAAGTGEVVPVAEMIDPQSNWNLGKLKDFSNVTYFKSDIFEDYVEQVVPRKTAGKKSADIYFLSPDGFRFRSMADVRRHLESNPEVKHEDNDSVMGDYDEEEDDVSLATVGDSEEGEAKQTVGITRSIRFCYLQVPVYLKWRRSCHFLMLCKVLCRMSILKIHL